MQERKKAFDRTTLLLHQFARSAEPRRNASAVLLDPGQPYLAMVRLAISRFENQITIASSSFTPVPEERRSADEVIATDAEAFRLTSRALQSVEIRNFKLLRHVELRFPEPSGDHAPWLMLLGENATGKTSLLQAIGVALGGVGQARRYLRPSKIITRGAAQGSIRVRFGITRSRWNYSFRKESPNLTERLGHRRSSLVTARYAFPALGRVKPIRCLRTVSLA